MIFVPKLCVLPYANVKLLDYTTHIDFAAFILACVAGGISRVRAFVLVASRERERRSRERIGEESS